MLVRTLALAAVLVGGVPARAAPGGGDPDQQELSSKDLKRYFVPYVPAVSKCYATYAGDADGTLRLELVIKPDGGVLRFGFVAPGVTGHALQRLDGCLRTLSATWHFPVRRGSTNAVMPFRFRASPITAKPVA